MLLRTISLILALIASLVAQVHADSAEEAVGASEASAPSKQDQIAQRVDEWRDLVLRSCRVRRVPHVHRSLENCARLLGPRVKGEQEAIVRTMTLRYEEAVANSDAESAGVMAWLLTQRPRHLIMPFFRAQAADPPDDPEMVRALAGAMVHLASREVIVLAQQLHKRGGREAAAMAVMANSFGFLFHDQRYAEHHGQVVACGRPHWMDAPSDATEEDRKAVVAWLVEKRRDDQALQDIRDSRSAPIYWPECERVNELSDAVRLDPPRRMRTENDRPQTPPKYYEFTWSSGEAEATFEAWWKVYNRRSHVIVSDPVRIEERRRRVRMGFGDEAQRSRFARELVRNYQRAAATNASPRFNLPYLIGLVGTDVAIEFFEDEVERDPPTNPKLLPWGLRELRTRKGISVAKRAVETLPNHRYRAIAAVLRNSFGIPETPHYYLPQLRREWRCGQPRWYGAPPDATEEDRADVVEWLKAVAVGRDPYARTTAISTLREIANVEGDSSLWENCEEVQRAAKEGEEALRRRQRQ